PQLDADGWTVIRPSTDTRIVYVSSSLGNDANDGLSQATPVKTLAKGGSLLRDGFPDWLLLKKGDTWIGEAIWNNISGRSTNEPMLYSSYGSGARPLIKTAADQHAITITAKGNYTAFIGIEFY